MRASTDDAQRGSATTRTPSPTETEEPDMDMTGKSILITGATGSFGQEFVRSILERSDPKRMVVYSRDELKQHVMQQAFPMSRYSCMRYFIGDVRDQSRLEMAFRGSTR